jgi:uncharacterized protein YkwD
MRTFLTTAILSLTLLATAAQASAACTDADTIPTAENLPQIRAALVCLHNEARAEANVALLDPNGRLATAAQAHAEDMVARQFFAHDNPSGVDPFERLRATSYIGRGIVWNAGETIAWASGAYTTPRTVMNSWMGATTQRLTVLAPDFRDIGIGIVLGAPIARDPNASQAVTYTVDYGWRTSTRTLRACLRRAENRTGFARRVMRAKCHGLGGRVALTR